MSRGKQKKLAVINDMTCFGRCALTVSIPVISALQVQCVPLPTALFSNHTAYPSCYRQDLTEQMPQIAEEWKKLGLDFDGILVGYLGSAEQMEVVRTFIREFARQDTIIIVDPIMGDNGRRYSSYTEEMCQQMKELIREADILLPNLTECCILTDSPLLERLAAGEKRIRQTEILQMAEELLREMAPSSKRKKSVVISGISGETMLTNLCLTEGESPQWIRNKRVGTERCGTGDVFAAILAADSVHGRSLPDSIRKAAHFIGDCILRAEELEIPVTDGICVEEYLGRLIRR